MTKTDYRQWLEYHLERLQSGRVVTPTEKQLSFYKDRGYSPLEAAKRFNSRIDNQLWTDSKIIDRGRALNRVAV